jgi:hypothetical protein
MKRKIPQQQSVSFQTSAFPWMGNNLNANSFALQHQHHEETANEMNQHQLETDHIKHMNDLREEDCLHFDSVKFANAREIFDEKASIEANRKHHAQHQQNSHHYQNNLPNPPGFKQHHHKITITNTVNKKLYIIVFFVLIFLIVELTVLRNKLHHNNDLTHQSNKGDGSNNNDHRPHPNFARIDFTSELMAVLWSALVCFSLCAMIQTFEVTLDSMTDDITYTRYRSLIRLEKLRFPMTGVRQIVARVVQTQQKKRDGGSVADNTTPRLRYSIDLAVLKDAMRDKTTGNKQAHHHNGQNHYDCYSSSDFHYLQVDSVVGSQSAQENVKIWVAFFQRMGGPCEVGQGDFPIDDVAEKL